MRNILIAAAVCAAGLLAQPAHADPYRWCAVRGEWLGGGSQDCYYWTLAQCRAQIAGLGGFCKPNPYYDGRPVRTPEDYDRRPRRRHRR
jgi:hypothetical protein